MLGYQLFDKGDQPLYNESPAGNQDDQHSQHQPSVVLCGCVIYQVRRFGDLSNWEVHKGAFPCGVSLRIDDLVSDAARVENVDGFQRHGARDADG